MNDAEIIKALEYCVSHKECADDYPCVIAEKPCVVNDPIKLLNLIKRQQEDIEKLMTQNVKLKKCFTIEFDDDKLKKIVKKTVDRITIDIKQAENEAIKEFAEKLKANFAKLDYKTDTHRKTCDVDFCDKTVNWVIHDITSAEIDNLVEELTGGEENDT